MKTFPSLKKFKEGFLCAWFLGLSYLFFGRNLLGWAVDMSSIGGAISFGYTSIATLKYAKQEKKNDIVIFAAIGFLFYRTRI